MKPGKSLARARLAGSTPADWPAACSQAYSDLAHIANWGGFVEIGDDELPGLLDLQLVEVKLHLESRAKERLRQWTWINDPILNRAIVRMADLIKQWVASSK
jgi:hypothetical protein